MAADQTGSDAPEQASNSRPPYLRLKARELLGEDVKSTNSWSILKDMKLSLVDGSVSILKQGIAKLTGAFSGRDLPKAADLAPTPVNSGIQSEGPTATPATMDSGGGLSSELSVVEVPRSSDETAAFGFDWVDNLLEELDASPLLPSEAGNNPPVTADADRGSSEEPLFPEV